MRRPYNKYRNQPTPYGDQTYASKAEAGRACWHDLALEAGAITGWRRGRAWVLVPPFPGGTKRDAITLTPDFELWTRPLPPGADPRDPPGAPDEVEDVKGSLRVGATTAVFRLKARLWATVYPSLPLYVVEADGTRTRYPPRRSEARRRRTA